MASSAVATKRTAVPFDRREERELRARPRLHFRAAVCGAILVISDLCTIALALEIAILQRTYLLAHVTRHEQLATLPFRHYLDVAWLGLVMVMFLAIEGVYTKRRSRWNEIAHLTKAIGLGFVAILAALTLTRLAPTISRATFLLAAANLLLLLPFSRYGTKRALGALGLWRKRILILGCSKTSTIAVRGLAADPFLAYEVVGALDDDPRNRGKCIGMQKGRPILVLGSISEFRHHVHSTQTGDILIAMPELPEPQLLALVHRIQLYCESIYLIPALCGLPIMNLQVDGFLHARLMMLRLSNNLAKPWNTFLKRCLDLGAGALIAAIALPFGALIALLIRLDSPGPAMFAQERLGCRGVNFRCLKFRTMHVRSDAILAKHLREDPKAADEWRRYAKLRSYDPRVTRLGKVLRSTSLDELPQLWNVLKGEMSLVGPRPYLPQERNRLGDELSTILSARPGMTGLWQVSGRNQLTLEERIQLEAWYLHNWSIWLDCIILAMTFKTVLLPRSSNGDSNNRPFDSLAPAENTPAAAENPAATLGADLLPRRL